MHKIFLTLVLSFFFNGLFCQDGKKIILLFGTTHDFHDHPSQNFSSFIDKLSGFHPDIICCEGIDPEDSTGLVKYRYEKMMKAERLRQALQISAPALYDSIEKFEHLLVTDPVNIDYHLKLAHFYFMHNDFNTNSDYHWWIARYLAQAGHITIADTLYRQMAAARKYSEYFNVVFPVAHAAKVLRLSSIDDQSVYPEDVMTQQKLTRRILFSFKALKAFSYYKRLRNRFEAADQAGNVLNLVNDTTYQNSISDVILHAYPHWSRSKYAKRVSELWRIRNKKIAENIEKVISSSPSKQRILVTIGAAHIPILKEYLSRHKDFQVIVYDEYK